MLQLVAPVSMTAEDRAAWTLSAVDALEDIRAEEVHAISAEIRRSVTRHNQLIPAIAEKVAERRKERALAARIRIDPPLKEPKPRPAAKPLSAAEIDRMPKWMKDMGVRVGFLRRDGNRLVDATA